MEETRLGVFRAMQCCEIGLNANDFLKLFNPTIEYSGRNLMQYTILCDCHTKPRERFYSTVRTPNRGWLVPNLFIQNDLTLKYNQSVQQT